MALRRRGAAAVGGGRVGGAAGCAQRGEPLSNSGLAGFVQQLELSRAEICRSH